MKWFNNMKIAWRLALGFAVVIALMLAIIVVSLRQAQTSHEKLDRIVSVNNVRVALANDMIDDARETAIAVRSVLLYAYRNQSSGSIAQELASTRNCYKDDLARARAMLLADDTEGSDILNKVEASGVAAQRLQDQVIELAVAGKPDEGTDLMVREAYPAVKKWIASVDDFIHHNEARIALRYEQASKAQAVAHTTMFILGAVAVALSVAIVLFLTLGITRPLKLSVQAADRIAAGDLAVGPSAAARRKDEIGSLQQSFNKMVTTWREQVRELQESVGVLVSSASELAATASQLAAAATESATSVSETTTSMEELAQTSRLSTEKAQEVSEAAQRTLEVADAGQEAVMATVTGINQIQEQMTSIAAGVVRLSEQSQAIGEIIAAVDDIAGQSNLLAVNAAIEAAKAGDLGKGFAVVAREVKSLAEQSRQATGQVRTILKDTQQATSAAVMATEQGSKAVDAGVQQSGEVSAALDALRENIAAAADKTSQIVAASQQQFAGVSQVTQAMESISTSIDHNIRAAQQLEDAARGLNELAQRLKTLAAQYTL